jgi:hypothetical protein
MLFLSILSLRCYGWLCPGYCRKNFSDRELLAYCTYQADWLVAFRELAGMTRFR